MDVADRRGERGRADHRFPIVRINVITQAGTGNGLPRRAGRRDRARNAPAELNLAQQLRQLGDVGCDASGFVARRLTAKRRLPALRCYGSQAYRANRADRRAWERALRPKPCRLALYRELRWRVAQKLTLQWSPQQISGWLKQEFPTHQDMQISHEAIYRSLFIQTRGVLKGTDGAVAYCAADASPQDPQREEWTGAYPRYGLHPRAAGSMLTAGCGM